jgi:hypothetical protein
MKANNPLMSDMMSVKATAHILIPKIDVAVCLTSGTYEVRYIIKETKEPAIA